MGKNYIDKLVRDSLKDLNIEQGKLSWEVIYSKLEKTNFVAAKNKLWKNIIIGLSSVILIVGIWFFSFYSTTNPDLNVEQNKAQDSLVLETYSIPIIPNSLKINKQDSSLFVKAAPPQSNNTIPLPTSSTTNNSELSQIADKDTSQPIVVHRVIIRDTLRIKDTIAVEIHSDK